MRIVLGYPARPSHIDSIRSIAPTSEVVLAEPATLGRELLSADIFCGHAKVAVDWDAVAANGQLRWIQSTAAGLDHCLHPAIVDSEIVVCSASGVFADSVAEQAMALLLGLLRRLHIFMPAWNRREFQRLPTDDLTGKTVGIVGLGGNGARIAEVLSPWCLKIVATDFFPIEPPHNVSQVWPPSQLAELLRIADVLILTAPLTEATRELISANEIAWLPRGAYLINVGRGQLVAEDPLVDALESGALAGAGLDVTYHEPPGKDSRLWSAPNLLVTPHVGAQSAQRLNRVTKLFCDNLARFLGEQRLINQVDKRLGFPHPDNRWQANR